MSAYNAEKYIGEAIESVLAQTFKDFEFIIIDDGSEDNSLAIAQDYQAKDSRIVIDSHENMGLGNSLNRAMKISKGEWIARMDADDIMLPNRLERQISYLQAHSEVDVASCWNYHINASGKYIGKLVFPNDLHTREDNKRYLGENKPIHLLHPGVIMRKSVVLEAGGYKPIVPGQDIELWNRLLERNAVIVCMPEILMKYRIHNESVTMSDYFKSLNYHDWIVTCMVLRRKGQAEISYQTFQKNIQQKPFLQRINRLRKLYSDYIYSHAAFLYGEKKYLSFSIYLLSSLLLEPKKIKRVINRLK
jgi:glycosyltransferase involved in cell wall biosynthesis